MGIPIDDIFESLGGDKTFEMFPPIFFLKEVFKLSPMADGDW